MRISHRQWWMFDICFVLVCMAFTVVTGWSAFALVAVAFITADRARAYWQTGDWASQPGAGSNGGAGE